MSSLGTLGLVLGGIALVVLLIGAVTWLADLGSSPPGKDDDDD